MQKSANSFAVIFSLFYTPFRDIEVNFSYEYTVYRLKSASCPIYAPQVSGKMWVAFDTL